MVKKWILIFLFLVSNFLIASAKKKSRKEPDPPPQNPLSFPYFPSAETRPQNPLPQGKISNKHIFFLEENPSSAHGGIKGLEHPDRLKPHTNPSASLGLFLRSFFPKPTQITRISSKPFLIKEEIRLMQKSIELMPEFELSRIFPLLLEARNKKPEELPYHLDLADGRKLLDCPIDKGTLPSVLATASLIEKLVENLPLPLQRRIRSFLLIRPPGHHACSHISGFCYLNNIIWAFRLAQKSYPTEHFAIIDLDLHDGDGTLAGLKTNSERTFFLNLFDKDIYPYVVKPYDPKRIDSFPFLIDYPLPAGTRKESYLEALDLGLRKLKLKQRSTFGKDPFIVFVSAGFDTNSVDSRNSFGRKGFLLKPEDYREIYQKVSEAYPRSHIICALEGGYHVKTLQESFIHAMLGLFN